jgi:hypothetical protein
MLFQAVAPVSGNQLQTDFDILIDLQQFDQISKAVFEENTQNLAIATQMAVGAADHTDFADTKHI